MDIYEKRARKRIQVYEIKPTRQFIEYCDYLIPLYEKTISLAALKESRILKHIKKIFEEDLSGTNPL